MHDLGFFGQNLRYTIYRKRLTIDISEIFPEKKENFFFFWSKFNLRDFWYLLYGHYFLFWKVAKIKKIELPVLLTILCGICRKKFELDSLKIAKACAF